jgi:hypothetical protein
VHAVEHGRQLAVAEIGDDLLGAVGEDRARGRPIRPSSEREVPCSQDKKLQAGETPTLITDMVRAVIASAEASGVDRFVVLSAFGVGDSLAKASFLVGPLFRTVLRKTYADKAASEVLLKAGGLKWTLEYPGALNNGDSTRYSAAVLEDVKKTPIFPSTSRGNVADFLLRSAIGNTFIRQIAVVFDAK